jgi:hypothetical protein
MNLVPQVDRLLSILHLDHSLSPVPGRGQPQQIADLRR